jgi:nucleotide-binding universal stress UspA family protein
MPLGHLTLGPRPAPAKGEDVGDRPETQLRAAHEETTVKRTALDGGNVAAPGTSHDADAVSPPRIVVGVDGSAASIAALRWAAKLAEPFEAHIDAVTVWEPAPAFGWGTLPPADSPETDLRRHLEETLDDAFPERRPSGMSAVVLQGPTAVTLLELARGAMLLVVGSRGSGGFPGLLQGSVSTKVVAHASGPVLVVRA